MAKKSEKNKILHAEALFESHSSNCFFEKKFIESLFYICFDNFEQNLVADVIEVMTVFTARMHGKRSHKNKRVCAL